MKNVERKLVEIGRRRFPMKKLIHGKEIREAMEEMERFRQQFNEQEFFYGARVYLEVADYDRIDAVCKRLETDKEYDARMEEIRAKEQLKREREQRRLAKEAERRRQLEAAAAQAAELQRQRDLQAVKDLARKLGLSSKELSELGE